MSGFPQTTIELCQWWTANITRMQHDERIPFRDYLHRRWLDWGPGGRAPRTIGDHLRYWIGNMDRMPVRAQRNLDRYMVRLRGTMYSPEQARRARHKQC